jgi:hypothetical protein
VTLGGIEMENEMYEWMPIKVKFLDGKRNLVMSLLDGKRNSVMSLEGCLRLPML